MDAMLKSVGVCVGYVGALLCFLVIYHSPIELLKATNTTQLSLKHLARKKN
jgi:hypothetical protein